LLPWLPIATLLNVLVHARTTHSDVISHFHAPASLRYHHRLPRRGFRSWRGRAEQGTDRQRTDAAIPMSNSLCSNYMLTVAVTATFGSRNVQSFTRKHNSPSNFQIKHNSLAQARIQRGRGYGVETPAEKSAQKFLGLPFC